MKKLFLITTLFFIPFLGISQIKKPIDSFMGITFGSDSDTFKKAIIAKGAHYLGSNPSVGFIGFEHATLFNINNVLVEAYFVNNKFYQTFLIFPNELGPTAIAYYYELIKNISQIYGPGEEHNTFATNYQQAEANEINAIQTKKATYMHYWADQNNNKIAITLDASLKVLMAYQDSALADPASAK
jgi:hypothetical protein